MCKTILRHDLRKRVSNSIFPRIMAGNSLRSGFLPILAVLLIPILSYAVTISNISGEISAAPHNTNYSNIKTAIESFDGAQVQSTTIPGSALKANAQIPAESIEGTTTNVSLQTFASNYRAGVQCVYEAAGNITVTSGEIMINGLLRRNTSSTDSAWTAASTTASGLDTGSEAASTIYYVYACADNPNATTFTVVLSTSSSAPSYSGATNYRLIGNIYNDGSSNINSVINTGTDHQGLKIAPFKFTSTGDTMAVTVGFQPVYVKVWAGDAAPIASDTVKIGEATHDMDIDNLFIYQLSATDTFETDATEPAIYAFTTTGFTVQTTDTYKYYGFALGY